jgi:hypothetical protein
VPSISLSSTTPPFCVTSNGVPPGALNTGFFVSQAERGRYPRCDCTTGRGAYSHRRPISPPRFAFDPFRPESMNFLTLASPLNLHTRSLKSIAIHSRSYIACKTMCRRDMYVLKLPGWRNWPAVAVLRHQPPSLLLPSSSSGGQAHGLFTHGRPGFRLLAAWSFQLVRDPIYEAVI